MLRTLKYYGSVNLAVALGAAVATAVLTGALLVGDSVRGSLRALTLDKLGDVHAALLTERFFRETLADELPATAPAVVVRGSATQPESGSRASRIAIHGVDERFLEMFGEAGSFDLDSRAPAQIFPSVAVNESLQRELNLEVGDAVVLRFGRWSDIPRETLMGDKDPDAVLGSLRATLTVVLPDRGLGRFGVVPTQQAPLNAFLSLEQLQRSLGQRGQVNALFAGSGLDDPDRALREAARLEDLGLVVARRDGFLELHSREFVLRPEVDRVVGEVVATLELPMQRTQSYLANRLQSGKRLVPYALVAALDPRTEPPWASLTLLDGRSTAVPGPDGILLNTWTAKDLDVSVGDVVDVTYFVVGPREELREQTEKLRVEGVVQMRGLGADRNLTPDYPGIQDARDMSDWDPPFPVDLDLIRPQDEAYWDEFGATPKAFVSEATGRRLWTTRFGSTTAVRVGIPEGRDPAGLEADLRRSVREALDPTAFGLALRPVREQGLRAAQGATDFAQLFLAFSMFLIVSAALLVGLLFRLGVEQRAREIGLLLAVGYRVGAVRRRLLAEGTLLAGLGGLVGLVGGVAYAAAMMAGLRTLWRPAVGSSELYLHVVPASLALGWAVSLLVVVVSIALAVRRLVRVAPPRLLAGSVSEQGPARPARLAGTIAYVALLAAIGLVAFALATGSAASPGLAFGSGALLLVSGLAFFAMWCRGKRRSALAAGGRALAGMAARNSAWIPGRSILSVCLVASASFVIVVVAANRAELDEGLEARSSGAGGFRLVAESDVPLHQDLGREADRFDLGFSDQASQRLEGAEIFPFRVVPGDDASCLNLYRPEKPRLLGVTHEFVERGGFAFQQHVELPTGVLNPWELLERPLEPGVIPAFGDFNSVMWILHLGLGQDLVLEDEAGRPLRLRLVGLLKKSVFQSELLISERALLEHFPSRSGDAYFLVDVAGDASTEVARLLETTLEPYGFDVTTTREKIAGYRVVENTYMATFQVLGGLGLLLGTVGLGVVLVRNVIERRGELATLRAFGFRRRLLAMMVVAENAFLLLVGLGIGTLAALAAAAPQIVEAGLPWESLGATLLLVAAVGMLSSIAAVVGTLRVPMLPALKAEP